MWCDVIKLYEAAIHTKSDAGMYEVDLYVKCPVTEMGLRKLNVTDLVQNDNVPSVAGGSTGNSTTSSKK